MHDTGSLIIVHLVERRPAGDVFRRQRADWPLHVTLVPWFDCAGAQQQRLLAALGDYGASKQPLTVTVGNEELFGPDTDVPVNLIVEQAPVQKLHEDLMAIVRHHGVQFLSNPSAFSGVTQAYRAHITHHTAGDGVLHRRFAGDVEIFDEFTAARLLNDGGVEMCEIIRNVALGAQL